MNYRKSLFISLMGLLIASMACESEDDIHVDQQKIETTYELVYDVSTDQTRAVAWFSFGSTYLNLNPPSHVTFNDDPLKRGELLGIVSYEKLYNNVVESGTFSYVNQDEVEYQNKIELAEPVAAPEGPIPLSVSKGGTIVWVGKPVAVGESVSLSIDDQEGRSIYRNSTDAVGATKFEIEPDLLTAGQGSILLVRYKQDNLEEGPEKGGSLSSRYISAKLAIEIDE